MALRLHRLLHRVRSVAHYPSRSSLQRLPHVLNSRHLCTASPNEPSSSIPSAPITTSSSPVSDPPPTDPSFSLQVTEYSADLLLSLHHSLSVLDPPFFVTLSLSALSLRLLSLPLLYFNHIHRARASLSLRELPAIQSFVRQSPGSILQKYLTFRRLRILSLRSAGTSPLRLLRYDLLVHIPLVISASLGVRQLSMNPPDFWHSAGPFWCSNLGAPDPTGIVPILTTCLWVWNVDPRSSALRTDGNKQKNWLQKALEGDWIVGGLQVLSVASLTMTMEMPVGVIWLWMSNGVVTSVQRALLANDGVRGSIGLMTKKEMEMMGKTGVLDGVKQGVAGIREELMYVQREVLTRFDARRVDESLIKDLNKALERERWKGRIRIELESVLRQDDKTGKKYVAVVRKGTGHDDETEGKVNSG